jgi:tetratricopeptide (TPR) repeat protein
MAFVDDARDFDAKWNYNDPTATEAAFREFLPAAREGGDAEYLGELLTQIARTFSLRGKFDEAHALLDEVEETVGDSKSVARVRYLLERGRSHNSSGDKETATTLFHEALSVSQDLGADFFTVDAVHMLAISDSESALDWNVKAIEMAEASKSLRGRKWLGSLYNNTGWTYFDLKDYPKALDYFERNLAFRHEIEDDDSIARWSIAKVKRMVGDLDGALEIQNKLLAESEAKGEPDGFVYEEIAECMLAKGNAGVAKPMFARAYELLKDMSWISESEPGRLPRLAKLGGAE